MSRCRKARRSCASAACSTSSVAAVEWSNDVGAADWIVERLLPFGSAAVGGFLPDGFGAYARVLHPWSAGQDLRKIRWSDLALEAGVVLGATTQREELESCAARRGAQPPRTGTLEPDELEALVDVLAPFTATPESCRFGVWEGYGWAHGGPGLRPVIDVAYPTEASQPPPRVILKPPPAAPAGPRVEIPGRSLALYEGPIEAAAALLAFPMWQTPISGGRTTGPGVSPLRSTSAPPTWVEARRSSSVCSATSASKQSRCGWRTAASGTDVADPLEEIADGRRQPGALPSER
jgi:hypothetical protein